MSQSPDEARARIQKYKEERRNQLIARTATLFSANVTERRPRKAVQKSPEIARQLHSSSELNLNTASTSVPIRTTRTSRLRAAAASNVESSPKKNNRSSSVQSLLEDDNSKFKDKKRPLTNRRQSHEKENIKNISTTSKDGAIRMKHSTNKNILEKDKSYLLVCTPKGRNVDVKYNSKIVTTTSKLVTDVVSIKEDEGSVDDVINNILGDNTPNSLDKDNFEELYKDLVEDSNGDEEVLIDNRKLKYSNKSNIPIVKDDLDVIVKCNGDVPKVKEVGLLGAVCIRKVEKFSELFHNLCAPCEADVLFEDLLVDNGIDTKSDSRAKEPECTPPCRRAQLPRITSTPKAVLESPKANGDGIATKTRNRRSLESAIPKTETSILSSKRSSKSTFNLTFGVKSVANTLPNTTAPVKSPERRRSSESGTKPSFIPVSKRTPDKSNRASTSPIKQSHSKEPLTKIDSGQTKPRNERLRNRSTRKSPEKTKSDSEACRKEKLHGAQKNYDSCNEKTHNSKKRLTSLDKPSSETSDAKSTSHKVLLNNNSPANRKVSSCKKVLDKSTEAGTMSTLHETLRPHTRSRLSQDMDRVAAITKQTLDRVNKLSNNLNSNKSNADSHDLQNSHRSFISEEQRSNNNNHTYNYGLLQDRSFPNRDVTERLQDIDAAAQRLIDFEKQRAILSDLNNDSSSQNRRLDNSSISHHTPVSILKRKSIHEDTTTTSTPNNSVASPPVTFSPNVVEPRSCRSESRQRQGILKKRRSLDESQVARRRSCSPEVSFADDGSSDTCKPILKNRRSSLEDVVRTRSPDGQIHGILKRKMSREDDNIIDDISQSSPEPHGILKRKSNSSSSSSTTSSHVSIAQAVLLAAAGGAEIIEREDDKETVRPILKKKSFSEERPCLDIMPLDTPKPILKKKSIEHDDHDFERPKKPILKSYKRLSGDEGHASSFDLSEDDRSSRRSSLLRSRTSDQSGSECEATVKPILKQRGSSLTRERSQSPRPRLSFCADTDASTSATNFSCEPNDSLAAGPRRVLNHSSSPDESYPSAVIRRRNLRPKTNPRSMSLVCDVNEELLSILNNRRRQVDTNLENGPDWDRNETSNENRPKQFPSIASRIKDMEQALTKDNFLRDPSKPKSRDSDRYKTQPVTIDELRSITSNLEPGQQSFQAFGTAACSFPTSSVESGAPSSSRDPYVEEPERDPFKDLKSPPLNSCSTANFPVLNGPEIASPKNDSYGEALLLDFEKVSEDVEGHQTLDEIEQEVNKVRVALDEDSRALEEDERNQGDADNWSLNVSCDSGVYNRASSRDSGPHSGEELGLIESQEIKENQEVNSSQDWSSSSIEQGLLNMNRERKSTENEALRSLESRSDDESEPSGFALGLVKSNSVVARASMWQQLQQKAKGTPKPLLRHSRSKINDGTSVMERFRTQSIDLQSPPSPPKDTQESFSLTQSKSTANVLDRDEDAKLDDDDPAKMSLMEKMKMFNSKLTHKPPLAGLKPREERVLRASRLRTMPVLASQVQEAMEQNERLTKSLTHEDVPRNTDFQLKMELFRSASAKNTSLEYLKQNAKFRSLDLDDDSPSERAQRMITPEVRGILKSGSTVVPKPKVLAKGESSEGLKDEGIDSSDDESSASSVSSSEKSCSSSDTSEELPEPKRRFQRKNKLRSSRTESDLTNYQDPRKVQLPGADELQERLTQAKNANVKVPLLGKLGRKPSETKTDETYKRFVKKLDEPIQLGKLRRPVEKAMEGKPPVLQITALNQTAKNKFFGIDDKERNVDELAARVRKYIAPVSKSVSVHAMEGASGSDGESSGGREVRQINTRSRHRFGGGVQRSATHAEMPHRGGTIAERLAALQAAGANDWRARVCRLSPERDDSKAIERAKNRINETLNSAVDDKKKVQIDENELGSNILADRRNKLETAAQGWRKRVPQSDATMFTVAGRLERDKVTPPVTPPPLNTPPATTPSTPVVTPAVPPPNRFRSRKAPTSPTNGFASGPLRSASCAVMTAVVDAKPKETPKPDRESFKRSHSVSENISRDEKEELSPGAEKPGCPVHVPRADDETFHAFFAPLQQQEKQFEQLDIDLDAIDSASRQLLSSEYARRAKRERRHVASRNPLKALAARTDLRQEYRALSLTTRDALFKEKVTGNCGLAAEALAALASKEDFSNVALRSASATNVPNQGIKALMLLHVKGRRRVQTRLVEPIHTNVNRGDCFLLVTSDQLFLYIGLYANVIEKNRSTDIANHILNTKDLGCKSANSFIKIDEQTKVFSNKHWSQFWSLLGVTEGIEEYKPVEAGDPDEDEIFESCIVQTNMCYEVMDDELVPIKEYWGQVPKIAMLNQSKVLVFDFGSEMYIWYGKNVPLESRRQAAQLAKELYEDGYNYEECHVNPLNAAESQGERKEINTLSKSSKTRPEWAIMSKVTQHMETILFKEKFLDWPDFSRVIKIKPQENKSNGVEITPCDAEEMWSNEYQDPDLILEGSHIGRGTHYYDKESMRHYEIKTQAVCKWLIQEYDYQTVENEADVAEFYSGDSYIIKWDYQITVSGRELNGKPSKHNLTGRDRCAYFCWQGKDASSNEKGAAALLTVELDKGKGPQVRVAQGTEPPAFLNLFQGNLVVHQGKRDTDKSRYRLYVTRGNVTNEAYLLQVPCSVRQLRSRGSLVLVDTQKSCVYIWHGSRSLKHTKQVAVDLANKLVSRNSKSLFGDQSAKVLEIKEGEEPKEVLEALGVANKQYYNSVLSAGKEAGGDVTPRLFHFTDLSGQFEANEVLSPLRHESLLTSFPFEQRELYSASQPALFLLDDGKSVWVWQGWWPRGEDGDIEVERNNGVGAFAGRWMSLRAAALRTADAYWTVSRRTRPDVQVVIAGLEPDTFTALFDTWEEHDEAADANIAEAFGMTKEEFASLPAWKQTNMKKDLGLF
ncbi:supervillin-like isoform X2 [Pieris napi]|uniref:supervillin-like isoform X2 n=1 Tax=Pieris napi TaxID=78633 RepID=UPI001FB9D33E|nr:supervillin-like isoform X2 [Pieris napi]